MSSLCLPKLRLTSPVALIVATVAIACGVPDYKVPAPTDAGNVIPLGTGGTPSTTGATTATSGGAGGGAGVGGSTSTQGTGGVPAGTGGVPQLLEDCSSDANCATFPATKKCNTGLRRCVECIVSADCGPGLYCEPSDFTCRVGCDSDGDCGSVACDASKCPSLTCDLTTHECVGCMADEDCKTGTVCDPLTKACVPGCNDTAKNTDCPSGWLCCGDTCANPLSDVAHCANCITTCAQANTNMECVNGTCDISSCKDNYLDCNADWHDGCEVNKLTNASNCGACGKLCSEAQACLSGNCGATSCADPNYKNCTNDPTGACTTNVLYDVQNCGGCGTVCSSTNGSPSCDSGRCLVTCKSGFDDCNAKVVDGCETDLSASASHCGSCTSVCTNAHGPAACAAGKCSPTCLPGFGDCDGDRSNGCEASETSDPAHCGSCSPCSLANATAACTNGACTIAACASNTLADCDGTASNGCEANLQSEAAHCGSCALACNSTNGTATCTAGLCGITCTTGFGNCDKSIANGCEVNVNQSVDNCGACGTKCPDQANGTATCINGQCGVSNCQKPYGDCDQVASNGCEANEDIDPNNCGGCGNKCVIPHATSACTAGVCTLSKCDVGFEDCNHDIKDGCEVNITTDANNCNACGSVCAPANAVGACVATGTAGVCTITSCKGSFQDCDHSASNGCEADTATNAANCGQCGATCSSSHGTPSCSGSVCSITCAAGFGDCDGDVSNGCEATTTNSATNCGTCGTTCVAQNGSAACLNSACVVSACSTNFQNCDGKYSNGCESNINSDLSNCGVCSNVCNATNGTATCTSGQCGVVCAGGFGNCDGLAANGCETNLGTSLQNCNVCGQACAPANAIGACASGNCSITACNTGFANCDALVGNGCETNLTNDPNNCNACGAPCSFSHASAGCGSRICTLGTCAAGYANCDSASANGCEVNTTNDPAHCGGCSTVCAYTNASPACNSSVCAMGACNTGFANCDSNSANGCEVNLNSDVNNCNGCGLKCPTTGGTPVCSGSPPTCGYSTCGAGLATCPPGGTCATNITTDVNNCGGCGTKCTYANAAASCAASACAMGACTAGYGNCDTLSANGCEVNLKTDVNNCNVCGTKCTFANASASCSNGTCAMGTCNAGYADCDGNSANGCEVNLKTDINNCNACNTKCSTTNGTATCNAGTCQIACNAGFANCDNSVANGCEVSTSSNTANCGGCGTVCNSTNGTATCTGGTCGITCSPGYGNCDGSAANGCETSTSANVNYCGSCNNVCSSTHGTASCTAGVCSIVCAAGYGNCDGTASNGCEAPLTADANNCGGCGTKCTYANASGVCSSSICSMGSCNAGFGDCNASTADGCETALTSTSNCGTCSNVCGSANATPSCAAGACNEACNPGYTNCDGLASNGCEQNTGTDVNHCGTCSTVCAYANATPQCAGGACAMGACTYLYGNCDGNASNGCEKPLAADPSNCGNCGTVCGTANGTASCSGGGCSIACSANYLNCDTVNSNGCEINKLTDPNNCGSCGHVCANGCTNGLCNTPCTGICGNPVNFTIDGGGNCTFGTNPQGACNSGNVGATAVCYQTTGVINGGGCSNFINGRTLSVNGVAETCDGSWISPLPAKLNGGYCINIGAGNYSYAAFYIW